MALPVYYPEYHGTARVPGPASRMPSALWQTPSTPLWQIFTLPVMARPHLGKRTRSLKAPVVRVNPGSQFTPKPNASIPPLSGAGKVIARGRFTAPSMSDTAGVSATCARAY